MNDTIQLLQDTLPSAAPTAYTFNGWMVAAVIELVIIILLLLRNRQAKPDCRNEIKKQVLGESIDFRNVVDSAFNADEIYGNLIRKCHPDRFSPDEEKMTTANDLSSRITKARHDVCALQQLKKEAAERLGIHFDE